MSELKPYQKYYPEFANPNAIRRIALKDSAIVEVLRIESPSSFFVRPIDHIRDQLVYREPYSLTPITHFDAGNYALAPIEDRVFGRCLIVKNIELLEACRVFFIDEAVTANVSWKCLFQIDENERFHPWQVMHVTLGRMVSLTNEWSLEQCQSFTDIITKFSKFQITACQVDIEDDEKEIDRPSLLVNLYGIPSENPNLQIDQKVAIEEICGVSMDDILVSIFPLSLTEDPKLTDLDKEQDDLEVILLEEFRRNIPEKWVQEAIQDWNDGDEDWDIETCRVVEWDATWLQKYLISDGCFWGIVSSNVPVSPWEMHITPIINQLDGKNDEQWILDQFEKINEQQLVFDDFYSNIKNQRPLEEEEIRISLQSGRSYAIAAVQNRKRDGAQWLRCEILDFLPNSNLAIRYVDQGFRGFQKIKNLHRIHRSHTKMPPFVMEMGRFFEDNTVSETEMEWNAFFWRKLVPCDVPIVVGPRLEFIETGKLQFSRICQIGETDINLLDEIPPSTFYTQKSDDLETDPDYDSDCSLVSG